MASSRKQAELIEQEAQARYNSAKRAHGRSAGALRRAIARRATLVEDRTLLALKKFESAIRRYLALHLDASGPKRKGPNGQEFRAPSSGNKDRGIRAAATGAGAGGLTGGALAAATYLGFATFGTTATTGTAIATLSGAAAHNATMAAIGGGALSASGGGMAAGAVVIGGIIAVPMVATAGIVYWQTGKKRLAEARARAKAIDAETAKLRASKAQADRLVEFLNRLDAADDLLVDELNRRSARIASSAKGGGVALSDSYLARSCVIAECTTVLASVTPWTKSGRIAGKARSAVVRAEREVVGSKS